MTNAHISSNAAVEKISSPCVKTCKIDKDAGLCAGCGRSLEEISQWTRLDPAVRERIMTEAPARLKRIAKIAIK